MWWCMQCFIPLNDCTVFFVSLVYKRTWLQGVISQGSWCESQCSACVCCQYTLSHPWLPQCLEENICCAAKFLFHSCLDNFGTFICLLTPSWINLRYCGSVCLPHPPTACQLSVFTLFGKLFAASKLLWKTANSIFYWKPMFSYGHKCCLLTL